MAWISYKDWLAKNKLTSTAANAANWERQYGVNGYNPKPAAAPAPPPPAYQPYTPPPPPPPPKPPDWNTVYNSPDAQGLGIIADNKRKYGDIRDNATKAYQLWATQNYGADAIGPDGKFNPNATGGMVARINRDTSLGVERQQNNAASRGMFRSGNRIVNEGKERTQGAERLTDLSQERERQELGMNQTITNANTDEQIANNAAYRESAQRQINDYWQKYGAGVYT